MSPLNSDSQPPSPRPAPRPAPVPTPPPVPLTRRCMFCHEEFVPVAEICLAPVSVNVETGEITRGTGISYSSMCRDCETY